MRAQGKEIDLADWPVAILAGGLSTRLRPATDKTPKALLSVAGEPFVIHQVRLLYSQGLRRIVLCVGYLGEMIEAELGDGSSLGMQIGYSFDGPTLLGTGGALKRALPKLGDQFLAIYGDSFMPVDYFAIVEAFVLSRKPALMTVFENESRLDVSNVSFEAGEIHRYDKKLWNYWQLCVRVAGGFLSSELEVARRMLRMQSTISERSRAWNATPQPIMSQN